MFPGPLPATSISSNYALSNTGVEGTCCSMGCRPIRCQITFPLNRSRITCTQSPLALGSGRCVGRTVMGTLLETIRLRQVVWLTLPSDFFVSPSLLADSVLRTEHTWREYQSIFVAHLESESFRNYNLPEGRSTTLGSLCFAFRTRLSAINTSLIEARLAIFTRSSSFSWRSIRFFSRSAKRSWCFTSR